VVLKVESYPASRQFALRRDEIPAVRTQGEMKHTSPPTGPRWIFLIGFGGKKREGRLVPCHKNRNAFPHSLEAALKPENFDVPVGRTFDVPDRERDVIESFQFKHYRSLKLQKRSCESKICRHWPLHCPMVRCRARLTLRKRGHGVA
jgi:hypothetical protein